MKDRENQRLEETRLKPTPCGLLTTKLKLASVPQADDAVTDRSRSSNLTNRHLTSHLTMKFTRLTLLTALLASLAASPTLRADEKAERPEKTEKPETGNLDGVRLPERFKDDAKLQELIAAAKTQREAFVAEQKELAKKLRGATADVKDKVKEQLKANREQFLEDTKQLRTDIRERVKELVTDLKAGNIKDGGKEGGGRGRRGGG